MRLNISFQLKQSKTVLSMNGSSSSSLSSRKAVRGFGYAKSGRNKKNNVYAEYMYM
jgi:cystathionine beta-lyase family protein involved in aluminum resistance